LSGTSRLALGAAIPIPLKVSNLGPLRVYDPEVHNHFLAVRANVGGECTHARGQALEELIADEFDQRPVPFEGG
jgi:hypothetical protein